MAAEKTCTSKPFLAGASMLGHYHLKKVHFLAINNREHSMRMLISLRSPLFRTRTCSTLLKMASRGLPTGALTGGRV